MSFCALVTQKGADGQILSAVEELDEGRLPEGNVLVGIEWAGFNYKDALCLTGKGGLVRTYPHVGGIDFAGRVLESGDGRYHAGQGVILTGWRVGESRSIPVVTIDSSPTGMVSAVLALPARSTPCTR